MYTHQIHEQQREGGVECTVSGRGVARTACHVVDLREGSDAKPDLH
jgi:hypothetical protein